jgi:hypothetical protein
MEEMALVRASTRFRRLDQYLMEGVAVQGQQFESWRRRRFNFMF